MFVGAIDSPLRKWLATNGPRWKGRTVFSAMAGNFTVEQCLAGIAGSLYSNDVGLYSVILGEELMGRRVDARFAEPEYEAWLGSYWEKSPAATTILLFEMLKYEKCDNPFTARLWRAWAQRFPVEFERVRARVEAVRARLKLADFSQLDIGVFLERAQEVDPHGIMVAILPRGTEYEKMYKRLQEIIAWQPPPYVMIDDQRKRELIDHITTHWDYVLYDDVQHAELPSVMMREKGTSKRGWLFSNLQAPSSFVGMGGAIEATNHARFTPEDIETITTSTRVAVVPVRQAQFDYYRALYLAKDIYTAACDLPLFVFLDGKLAGFLAFNRAKIGSYTSGQVFLLTDFCVPSPEGARLSKLILWLTRTDLVREIVSEKFLMNVVTMTTVVFTDKPVSSKYQGVFDLLKRGMNDLGQPMLVYDARAGEITVPEAIKRWRNGKIRSAKEAAAEAARRQTPMASDKHSTS